MEKPRNVPFTPMALLEFKRYMDIVSGSFLKTQFGREYEAASI